MGINYCALKMKLVAQTILKSAFFYTVISYVSSTGCLGQNISGGTDSLQVNRETWQNQYNLFDKEYNTYSQSSEDAFDNLAFLLFDSIQYGFTDSSITVQKFLSDSMGTHEALRIDLDKKGKPYHVHIKNHSSAHHGMNSFCLQTGKKGRVKFITLGLDSIPTQSFEFDKSGQLVQVFEYESGQVFRTINFNTYLFSRGKISRITDYFDNIKIPINEDRGYQDFYRNFNFDILGFKYDFLNTVGVHIDELDESSEVRSIFAICEWSDNGTGAVKEYYFDGQLRAFGNVNDLGVRIGSWTFLKKSGEIEKIKVFAEGQRFLGMSVTPY